MHPLIFIVVVVCFSMLLTGIIYLIDDIIQEDEDELQL